MQNKQNIGAQKTKINLISYGSLAISCVLTTAISITLYIHTQDLLKGRLIERLVAIVSTASLNFSTEELNSVIDETSLDSKEYSSLINKLQLLRNYNKNLKFAYILRPTADPNIFQFIADADSLDP